MYSSTFYSQEQMNVFGVLIGLALLYFIWVMQPWRKKIPLPPGPKGLPLIGHVHLMPPSRPWIWFEKLGKEYSTSLVYLNLAGQDTIIINDYDVALELLEKRSANYSSRPRLVYAFEYGSTGKRLVLLPYGEAWRKHRSAFHREMTPTKSASYAPIQAAETKILMRQLLKDPGGFMNHFKVYSAGVVLKLCYGLNSEDGNEKAIADVYEVLEQGLASCNPGAHLVDLFPSLDLLPDILAPWRAGALAQRALNHRVFNGLLNDVSDKVRRGELAPDGAFAARLLHDKERIQMDDLDVAYLAGTMFEAGVDTTASALSTFVLASASYPAVFLAAQSEIDKICGDHPPTLDDLERCEYVRALCKETLRWRTVTAGGLPHKAITKEDDFYAGYRIPAGATLIPNHWGMCFSEKTFGQKYDPLDFEPRRWVERDGGVGTIDEDHPAFGFGRRICPGRHLAIQSMFLVIANLCYYFDIKAIDGVVMDTYAYSLGFNIEPEPFECKITPRRSNASDIEREAEAGREALRGL